MAMLGCSTHLQEGSAQEFRALVERRVARGGVPGVSAALLRVGEAPVFASAGKADLEAGEAMSERAQVAWFSVTKLLTALGVVGLAEKGHLELDAPVRQYLPDFPSDDEETPVRVWHLLSHSAGIANPIPVGWIHLEGEQAPAMREWTYELLAKQGALKFTPGSRQSYSNVGYLVLGLLIEAASGERYVDYLTRAVLQPLDMDRSGFAYTGPAAVGYQRPWNFMGIASRFFLDARFFGESVGGYRALKRFYLDGAPYGGVIGTVEDMARFAQACIEPQRFEEQGIVSAVAFAQMLRPALEESDPANSIGLGWHLRERDGHAIALHEGGGGGFHTEVRIYPGLAQAVVVVGNETSFDTGSIASFVQR